MNQSDRTQHDPFLHQYFARFSPPTRSEAEPCRIAFLAGSLDISGGTYVILQHALHAQRRGAEVTLVEMFPMETQTPPWHPALIELETIGLDELEGRDFDLAIATYWRTVYELPRVRSRHHAYFVQSVETRFALGTDLESAALAELTYTFDLPVITIARWIQAYLAFRHRRPAFLVRNGIRKEIYSPVGPSLPPDDSRPFRVIVEGAIDVPMKNVEHAIALANEGGADEVWLLTSSTCDQMPGVDRVFSRLPIEETASIYRSCPVMLKLSLVEGMYGPPLEHFHCGGTVVTNDVTGHEEYVRTGENGLVVPTSDDAATIRALRALKRDPSLLARLRAGALRTARAWPDWNVSSEEFWQVCQLILRQPRDDSLSTMLAIRGAGVDLHP